VATHTSLFRRRALRFACFLSCALFGSLTVALADAPSRIHPGDKINVVVMNHPDLSVDTMIAGDGTLSMPILGPVHLGGLTLQAASAFLDAKLSPYLKYPAVDVRVDTAGQTIFVTGSTVGSLSYQPGETLVVAIAGWNQQQAALVQADPNNQLPIPTIHSDAIDLRNVGILRDGKRLGSYNVEDLGRHGNSGPLLEPGDEIMLSNKPIRVDVHGDVRKSGPQYLYPGETLAQAIDEAGGLNTTASTSNITLDRGGAAATVSFASQTVTSSARDGDSLEIHPAPVVSVVGMVGTPGSTALKSDTTLLTALYLVGGPNRYADLKHVEVVRAGVHTSYDISRLAHGDLSGNAPLNDGDVVFVPEGHRIDILPFISALGGYAYAIPRL
jgi:polysaccharide export outer membrane protein